MDIQSTILKNLSATLGNGVNSFTIDSTAIIGGNATITGGSGNNAIGLSGGSFLGGSLYVGVGNGINSLTMNGAIEGSGITYTGGNGQDTVRLGSTGSASNAKLTAVFGSGTNAFEADDNLLGSANVLFGKGSVNNVISPTGGFSFPITLRNL